MGFELVVLRPGVIYGPGGGHFSGRVGLNLFGIFLLHLGGSNLLPLTYVEKSTEAIVVAGTSPQAAGRVYNVHDDNLPTSRQYLRLYKRSVKNVRSVWVPYTVLKVLSRLMEKYHRWSKGQLPAIFTGYKSRQACGREPLQQRTFEGDRLAQLVSTSEGLRRTFKAFRTDGEGR